MTFEHIFGISICAAVCGYRVCHSCSQTIGAAIGAEQKELQHAGYVGNYVHHRRGACALQL